MVTIVSILEECNCSNILIAKFAPSIGSVPEPSSSINTREFEVALSRIDMIFSIWEENVLSELRILWSSPISANTLSKT